MVKELRTSGIDVVGDVPWGTHLCQFYQTKEDLLDILVPYFKAGLENNELCLWVISEPLNEKCAREAMEKSVANFDEYLEKGRIQIIPHTKWYRRSGTSSLQKVLNSWSDRLNQALHNGLEGMRVTGNTAWLTKKHWPGFMSYEKEVNDAISKCQMIAICTYSLDECGAPEIIDTTSKHQFALIKRAGKWETIEPYERKQMEYDLAERVRELRCIYDIANVAGAPNITLYQRYKEIVNMLPQAWQYPEITCARIAIGNREFKTKNYSQTAWKQSSDIIVYGAKVGVVEVNYLEERPDINEGPFSKEERLLIDAVAERLGTITEHKQAEEALKESEEFSNSLLENSPDPIVVINPDTSISYINPAFEKLTGFTPADITGKKAPYPWWPEESKKERGDTLKTDMAGSGNRRERINQKKSGERFWAVLNSVPVTCNGALKYFLVNWVDITERKQAEELLKTVSHNSPLGIYILRNNKLQYTNPQFQKLTSYSEKELRGRNLLSLVVAEDSNVVKSSIRHSL